MGALFRLALAGARPTLRIPPDAVSRLVIVVAKASDWGSYSRSENVVVASDYLKEPIRPDEERTQVINLCCGYKYLGTGC